MSGKRGKKPSAEDMALWRAVEESAQPLPDHARNLATQFDAFLRENATDTEKPALSDLWKGRAKRHRQPAPPPSISHTPRPPASANPIDDRTHRKLARGRMSVDRRLDLHGLTQAEARARLLDELQLAQWSGARLLLVITGKGDQGMGVLRQNVPRWLASQPFSSMVNGVRPAASRHGGDGALYVRVRRLKKAAP